MTKEEALAKIEDINNMYKNVLPALGGEALESAKEAIEVNEWAISALKSNWIPIEERRPTEDGEYLLWGKISEDEESDYRFIGNYDACGEEFGDWEDYYDSTTLGFLDSELHKYHEVLAWQPLPEPYKEKLDD